ncbi:MAG: 6-phosphofructokinase [Acidobacteriota bacterium]
MARTIGILTGGGDVPGLNPCIKTMVSRVLDSGDRAIGIRRGWGGLLQCNPLDPETISNCTLALDKQVVRTIDRTGGTFLHTSRTNPAQVKKSQIPSFLKSSPEAKTEGETVDFTCHVLRVLDHLKIDALIAMGGDDTLGYAHRVHQEGFPVVAVPKTMDNDVYGTDYCIGFSTAVTRSVDFITQLRTSMGSHERIGIVELFGRNSGETSLISAYLSGVDRAVISEVPFDLDKLANFLVEDRRRSPSNYAIMTISEGARMIGGEIMEYGPTDAFGHKKLGGIGFLTAEEIERRTGVKVIYQRLAYLMRSGAADSLDRMVAINYGNLAVELLQKGETGRLVVIREGRYGHQPLDIIAQGVKRVDVEMFYDEENYRPTVWKVLDQPMFLY